MSSSGEGKCLVCSKALLSEQTRAAHWLLAGCEVVAVLNSNQQNTSGYTARGAQDEDDEVPKDVTLGFSSLVQHGPALGFPSHNTFKMSL